MTCSKSSSMGRWWIGRRSLEFSRNRLTEDEKVRCIRPTCCEPWLSGLILVLGTWYIVGWMQPECQIAKQFTDTLKTLRPKKLDQGNRREQAKGTKCKEVTQHKWTSCLQALQMTWWAVQIENQGSTGDILETACSSNICLFEFTSGFLTVVVSLVPIQNLEENDIRMWKF